VAFGATLLAGALIPRTVLEDRELHSKRDGYADYARATGSLPACSVAVVKRETLLFARYLLAFPVKA
jgi:hypothetical protein